MPITYFVAFLVALMVGAALTLVVRHFAHRFGWLDQARSSRKVHRAPIPRLGGVAIVGGFFAPLLGLFWVDSFVGETFQAATQLVWGLFIGGLAIALLGLYDDLRGAGAPLKFAVQCAVAFALYQLGARIEVLANPFGAPLQLGVFSLPFTVLWIVGVVNAMNLIDGLDGLAGGVAFFAVATNFALAATRGDILMCLMMAALGGAILGFLVFNFNPASIFMGDTGSMFLGFVLAITSVVTSTKSGTAVAILVPVISLGLPIMDTLLAMVRRTLLGRPMFSADKEHIHHRLMSRVHLSHRNAVLVLYALCCLFGLTALGLSFANSAQSAMLLAGMAIVIIVLMRKLGYLTPKQVLAVNEARKRNVELRAMVKNVIEAVRTAEQLTDIWAAIAPLAGVMDAAKLELALQRGSDGGGEGFSFSTTRPSGSAVPLEVRLEIRVTQRPVGFISMSWCDGRSEVNRDEELALELVADSIGETAARLFALEAADPDRVVALRK
ncbi:MAG: MraY family glycosyltransferase [Myxococcota bacterium]